VATFNTTSPRQRNNQADYRGSYTAHLTAKQFQFIMEFANSLDIELEALWEGFFDDDYLPGNWRDISINAASEIIDKLITIQKIQAVEAAFMRKMQRTEEEQHEWEFYPDGKL